MKGVKKNLCGHFSRLQPFYRPGKNFFDIFFYKFGKKKNFYQMYFTQCMTKYYKYLNYTVKH